jgi:CRP/FNR family transcriptional regulator
MDKGSKATLGRHLHLPVADVSALPCARCVGRHLNLCKPLDDKRLARLLSFGGPRVWPKGATMFRAGEPMGPFFKIRSGIVAVFRVLDDGRRQVVALRAPGDCIGYLEQDGAYSFEVQALTEVEACAFDRRQFDIFAAQNPDLAVATAEELSRALKRAGQAMVVLGQLKSTERVAHFLVEIEALYRERHVGRTPLSLLMNRTQIADYLGLTVETVSRAFGKLREQAVIKLVGNDDVIILDHAKLKDIGKV